MAESLGERDAVRALASGCLASPVGFVLSALVLIPLWWIYPLSHGDSSVLWPTIFGFFLGIAYSISFGLMTAIGLPRTWWMAVTCIAAGVGVGIAVGDWFQDVMHDGCLQGTGPQPDWCSDADPAFLRPIVPAYSAAFAFLGLALWVGAALQLGRRIDSHGA